MVFNGGLTLMKGASDVERTELTVMKGAVSDDTRVRLWMASERDLIRTSIHHQYSGSTKIT